LQDSSVTARDLVNFETIAGDIHDYTCIAVPNNWVDANGDGIQDSAQLPYQTDLNQDGRPEIINFGYSGTNISWNHGSSFSSPLGVYAGFSYYTGGWSVEDNPRTMLDVNKDGYPDIVGFGNAGVYVALNNGINGFSTAGLWNNSLGYNNGDRPDQTIRLIGK